MSWVIVDRATGQAVCETWQKSILPFINHKRYDVIPIGKWLASLNSR